MLPSPLSHSSTSRIPSVLARPLPQVYPWKFPGRSRAMTIALGVLAKDGVVLAADTELTWGYLKTSGEKIWTTEAETGALAIAGAGPGGYLEAVSQQLIDDFQSLRKPITSE